MSLRDGTKKMSKSDPSDMSRINLTDDADTIAAKIRKARTDPEPLPDTVAGLAGRAEAANLVNIYAALADTERRGRGRRVRRQAVLASSSRASPTSPSPVLVADHRADEPADRRPGRDRPPARPRRRPRRRHRRADPRPHLRDRRPRGRAVMHARVRPAARFILTLLLIGSLSWSAFNLWTIWNDPLVHVWTDRAADRIAARLEAELHRAGASDAIVERLRDLLAAEPRDWARIDALADLADEMEVALPEDLRSNLDAARAEDSSFFATTQKCGLCMWNVANCDLSSALYCRVAIDLTRSGTSRRSRGRADISPPDRKWTRSIWRFRASDWRRSRSSRSPAGAA